MAGIAGILELIGGLLILLGLFTRVAAFILSGEMRSLILWCISDSPGWPIDNHGELAVIFCFVFLYLAAACGGPFSLENIWMRQAKEVIAR